MHTMITGIISGKRSDNSVQYLIQYSTILGYLINYYSDFDE